MSKLRPLWPVFPLRRPVLTRQMQHQEGGGGLGVLGGSLQPGKRSARAFFLFLSLSTTFEISHRIKQV